MEMLAAHRGYKKEFDGKIIFVDGEVSWEGRPGSKGRLFTVHGYLDRQRNENRTANSLGKLELSRTANEQRSNSHHRCTTMEQWKQGQQ